MRMEPVTAEQLRAIARDVGELSGWDFSGCAMIAIRCRGITRTSSGGT